MLRADRLDDKTLIHNYGHGGAGMSIAWGTGAMAADLALQHQDRRVAVLGCGSPGLTAARQLQRRGFKVTIYAMSIPPDTTSNMSMAGYTPVSGLVANDRRSAAWDAQFRQAAEISYRQLQLMVGTGYGVYWQDGYNATDNPEAQQGGGGVVATTAICFLTISARARTAKCLDPASIRFRRSTRSGDPTSGSSRRSISTPSCATSSAMADAS